MIALWRFVYRCEATSVAGFVQQLAVSYVGNGYVFYVPGVVPLNKDPKRVDEKLIERLQLNASKWTNARAQRRGEAKVQLLRYRYFFVLLATHGEHDFFLTESNIEDVRRRPLTCFGYSIGLYKGSSGAWHPSVRIEKTLFEEFKYCFSRAAVRLTTDELIRKFENLRFEPYAPVRKQCFKLLSLVNRARESAGLELVPASAIKTRRMSLRVFGS
jgi:hypothetical protein